MHGGKVTGLLVALVAWSTAVAQQAIRQPDSHLAAAQNAQRSQDYATAEREYRAAIAVMPGYAELHMNLGLALQMQGRIPEAMTALRRAVELKPTLAGANLMLGIDLCNRGLGTQAIPFLKAAVALDPGRMEGYAWLATAQESSGNYQAELMAIRSGLNRDPQNMDLEYLEGHAFEELGRQQVLAMNVSSADPVLSETLLAESYATSAEWPSAVLHLRKAIAASPQLAGLHVRLGEVLLRAGKVEQARGELEEELRIDPASVRAIVRRGELELLAGDCNSALHDWAHALDQDSRYAHHLLGLDDDSTANSAETLPPATLEQLHEAALQLLPLNGPAADLARAYIDREAGKEAVAGQQDPHALPLGHGSIAACTESSLRNFLKQGHVSDVADCGRGGLRSNLSDELRTAVASSLLELGDCEQALRTLAEASPDHPQRAQANYLRARCYEQLATAAYLRLYRAHPDSFRVHQLMGDLAAARDDDNKAIEEYRAAIALKPSTPNLHYSLAHVLWKNSDIPAARAEYQAELAITPMHMGALHDLGQTYLMEHDPGKALSFLSQAVSAGASGPDVSRDLGTAYAQLGQYRRAEASYMLALPDDHDGSIHFKLARVYRSLGEKEKASHEFAVAADLNRKYHGKLEQQAPELKESDE